MTTLGTSLYLIKYYRPSIKTDGFHIFIYFVLSIALSQLFLQVSAFVSLIFLSISIILILYTLIFKSAKDHFYFLFFTSLMHLKIPFAGEREFAVILPILFFSVNVINKYIFKHSITIPNKVNKVKISIFLLGICVFISFIDHLQLPYFDSDKNSGFLSRWSIINTFFVFFTILITYQKIDLIKFIKRIYFFYLTVLAISLLMIMLNIPELPIFNTYSWVIIKENALSERMIIAGIAAIFLLIYELTISSTKIEKLPIYILILSGIIFSGGRSTFISFFIIIFCNWAINKSILGKSMILSIIPIFFYITISLSPLIYYIPTQFQRLFIIFPSDYYGPQFEYLSNSSAASSSNFRYEMWSKAIPEIVANPILGKGFGIPKAKYEFGKEGINAFRKVSQETIISDFIATGGLHNTYISIAYIMGIPAALFFLYGFFKLLIRSYLRTIQMENNLLKKQMTFFTLILIYYLVKSIISDIHFELDFFAFFAIIFKTIYNKNFLT